MAQDTKGHWLGAIYGRKGHVQSATLYGDDIEALIEFLQEHGDLVGIILKVGVHRDDELAAGAVEASAVGGRFAKVSAKLDDLNPRIPLMEGGKHLDRPIGAAVVDKHHLEALGPAVHHLGDPAVQGRQAFLLVVDRKNKGKGERFHQMSL